MTGLKKTRGVVVESKMNVKRIIIEVIFKITYALLGLMFWVHIGWDTEVRTFTIIALLASFSLILFPIKPERLINIWILKVALITLIIVKLSMDIVESWAFVTPYDSIIFFVLLFAIAFDIEKIKKYKRNIRMVEE